MVKSKKNDLIFQFILDEIHKGTENVAAVTAKHFNVTRMTANRYLQELRSKKLIVAEGETKAREYALHETCNKKFSFNTKNLQEDKLWRETLLPNLKGVPTNIVEIFQFAVTEMINNVIDHSGSNIIEIGLQRNAKKITIWIKDEGVGIFKKIQQKFQLDNPMHALLELSKGKLTTDPKNHSGEGIFFTSRMMDKFVINSGELNYFKNQADDGVLSEEDNANEKGTLIEMTLNVPTERTCKEVFDEYTDDDFRFSKTQIPVVLARYGQEQLVSRSQAKRLLARFEKFSEILLDFKGVDEIGQAFADEIFRVFKNAHPNLHLTPMNTTSQVKKMIAHAHVNDEELKKAAFNKK